MRARLVVAAAALVGFAAGLLPAQAGSSVATLRIWPLGDSITLGISAPQNSPGGYRTTLDQILTRSGTGHRFVGMSSDNSSPTLDVAGQARHDGHGGYRVDQIRRDLDGLANGKNDLGGRWLTRVDGASALNPDVVLVHLGTNDILQRWDPRRFPTRNGKADLSVTGQRRAFVADLTARLADLVLRIHALRPRTWVVVSTIVPIDMAGYAATVADYAASVRQMLRGLSARHLPFALADAYAAFVAGAPPGARVAPGLMSNDAIHPSPAGYALIARTFAAVLEGRTLPMPASAGERP